jgi:spore coat protein A
VDWRLTSRFQLQVDGNGDPIPVRGAALPINPAENALKETWQIPPGQGFSVRTTFTDHTGRYVFHCHMLEHEDMSMMAQFEVQPANPA